MATVANVGLLCTSSQLTDVKYPLVVTKVSVAYADRSGPVMVILPSVSEVIVIPVAPWNRRVSPFDISRRVLSSAATLNA